ncbi:MAG: flagellar motor protein MotB [Pseudomonadales bacterium]|jgi:chemotaxis protein MotB|nr:flagellar motor protein MotB [Pseudomonadales bacterium]
MEEVEEKKEEGGGAGWVMTFADLMSLLMCFFVLLLSFSEMDVLKFKRLAGSMSQAFGVQAQVRANDPPKGTSIIAQEFSPGTPRPTPLNEIWQKTTDESRNSLDVACQDMGSSNTGESGDAEQMVVVDKIQDLVGETEQEAIDLATALSKEIAAGVLEIETSGRRIILRIKEHGSFPSGTADLSANFKPVLKIIRQQLRDMDGRIIVEGHTDDDPINTPRFRSNWALSSARAVSVAHGLFEDPELDQERFTITGFADTKPLVSNTNAAGKARNRRVEVVIHQGLGADVKNDLEILKNEFPATYENVRQELIQRFELSPEEIF